MPQPGDTRVLQSSATVQQRLDRVLFGLNQTRPTSNYMASPF